MYKKIMVPLDGSELAECVLPNAETMARQNDAELVLVRVVEPISDTHVSGGVFVHIDQLNKMENDTKQIAAKYLEQIKARLNAGNIKSDCQVLIGNPASELIEFVEKNKIDLIIIASHGRSGVGRWIWGSTAEKLLHHICIPILMIRAPGCFPNIK
jgi:nucleotide-binding universal stress UspA family protein